jgi:membrane-bound inhibitor of C-type lysozyme
LVLAVLSVLLVGASMLFFYREVPLIARFLGLEETTPPRMRASYTCDQGKTINASFFEERVVLLLSDGRALTLGAHSSPPEGSGVQESIFFWVRGRTAFLAEGDPRRQSYTNCVTAARPQGERIFSL